ncbi:DUF4159 domain-containing protein [Roseomonas sp. OT10]|uniref:DUF4159 domain-containing protein n=1 Tax=Roseomonas cutis TaxID=2897332 RepID=UPI001E442E87|nr:DUF4159 domain-containing protein [Roseomonas sp. OT10]UFN50909.1 DUF4159 domain-containing protein [Roseomonas sp. OT10]
MNLGPLLFASPWLLVALPALPALWWLLRVTPPSPRRQPFPPARLLRDLSPMEETPARTPWWLLLLRLAAAALIILGLARPVWEPVAGAGGSGPLLLVMDDGWASASDWPDRLAVARAGLDAAAREGRSVALLATAPSVTGEPPRPTTPLPAEEARARLAALRPKPWSPDRIAAAAAIPDWARAQGGEAASLFVTDGLAHDAADRPGGDGLMAALAGLGPLSVARRDAGHPIRILPPPRAEADRLRLTLRQPPAPTATEAGVLARTGDGRTLARAALTIPAGAIEAEGALELPIEIREQVVRLDLEEASGAAGTVLLDERFRRRPVGLLAGDEAASDAPLTGALYYLDRGLAPYAEIRRGSLESLLSRKLAVLVLADRPLTEAREIQAVTRFVEEGGLLLRFAGPRMAEHPDPLLPVTLRAGERQLGGSLSWEQPQRLAPFPDNSPFAGLPVPPEVTVSTQVLAEPAPRLAERSWARLADGTPLVTGASQGAGRIVLVHVTSNADWSDLPLSGLFVDMLRRLVTLSAGVTGAEGTQPLAPLETLDGFGHLGAPPPVAAPIAASAFAETVPGPRHPPGWYGVPGEGGERRALNLSASLPPPRLAAPPPPDARVLAIGGVPAERDLGPWLLAAALLLLAVDLIASLAQRGLLPAGRTARAAAMALALLLPAAAQAQPAGDGSQALATRLAFIATGDAGTDDTARAGLVGLSDYVNRRTAASLADPAAVRPGVDDLSFYPLLYWIVLPDAPDLDPAAAAALNAYMRLGGIVLFDTRDEGSGEGTSPGSREALRRVTRDLSIPPLAPIPEDHVLRRSFYLLPELPGRWAGGTVWVARDQDRANDSVSPAIIGGHDWASAWAIDARGNNPHAVVPGGARQRTLAYRFGVNLVIYALTGNYKGDQVHVPAILERLGN